MEPALLDTDTLSEIMRGRNPAVLEKARACLSRHGRLCFSLITRYEILRGLKAKAASAQIDMFERQCARSDVLVLTDEIVVRAADLYALLRRSGRLISNADLLIGATAAVHGRTLVTNNVAHFDRIPNLPVDSWGLLER